MRHPRFLDRVTPRCKKPKTMGKAAMRGTVTSGGIWMRKLFKAARDGVLGLIAGDDIERQIRYNIVQRPNYVYIMYRAADLARRLGLPAISVLEFGVAGGRGLLAMEEIAARVEALTGVQIEIYGFDSGAGLPPPVDYRDLPYIWQEAHFTMDVPALQARLKRAKLVMGLVSETVTNFAEQFKPAPVGAISFDLDYYSSTMDAFGIFDLPAAMRLPRIFCYFDDILSSDLGHVGASQGVPLAISDFLATRNHCGLDELTHLEFSYAPARRWHRQIYSFGDFTHPRFNDYIITGDRQLAI